jgi:hypothetical protein
MPSTVQDHALSAGGPWSLVVTLTSTAYLNLSTLEVLHLPCCHRVNVARLQCGNCGPIPCGVHCDMLPADACVLTVPLGSSNGIEVTAEPYDCSFGPQCYKLHCTQCTLPHCIALSAVLPSMLAAAIKLLKLTW